MFCVKGCHVFCYLAKLSYCSIILLIFFEFLIAKFQNCTFCLFPRCFHLSIEIRTVFVFALRPFLPMSVHGISFAKLSQIFVLSDKNPILNTHFSTLKKCHWFNGCFGLLWAKWLVPRPNSTQNMFEAK